MRLDVCQVLVELRRISKRELKEVVLEAERLPYLIIGNLKKRIESVIIISAFSYKALGIESQKEN